MTVDLELNFPPIEERCPFCNSSDCGLNEQAGTFVECEDCGCEGPWTHAGPDAAVALWNRRPPPDAPEQLVLETNHGSEEEFDDE